MDIIKKKNARNKIILISATLFAPMLIVQFIILMLLSSGIIGIIMAVILTVAVMVAVMGTVIMTLWSFFNPLISVFTNNSQITIDNKTQSKIQKLASRNDGVGEMIRTANNTVTGFADVIKGIKGAIDKLGEVSAEFENTFNEMESSMHDTSGNINTITDNTLSQVDNIHDMKDKIDSISMAIENINSSIKALAKSAEVVGDCQKNAGQIMDELTSISKESSTAIEEVKNQTDRTNKSAQQIRTATEIIADISNQTNLLALNASIEAARAGEAGRGFAVVATQIQKLAEESNSSVSRIEDNIQLLVEKITGIVGVMGTVNEALQKQEQNVNRTKDIFDKIHQDVMEITYRETNMQQSVSGMNQAKDNMSNIIIELSESARNNPNLSENAAEMTTQMMHGMEGLEILTVDLTELANRLDRNLKSFRLD